MYDKRATSGLSWDEICRRASGRRQYNSVRQFRANYRLTRVTALLRKIGMGRGCQSRIAEMLGVHRSTVSRDLARVRRRMLLGPRADEMFQARAKLDRIARAEDAAELEYNEQRKIEAAEILSERVALDVSVQTPIRHPVQVPKWLPLPRSPIANRPPLAQRTFRLPRPLRRR
jgi:hypothetical protein